MAHEPFESKEAAIIKGTDIVSDTLTVEQYLKRRFVADTDIGAELKESITDLEKLLKAYRDGVLKDR